MKNKISIFISSLTLLFFLFSITVYGQNEEVKKFESINSKIIKKGDVKLVNDLKIDKRDKTTLVALEKNISAKLEISNLTFRFLDYFQRGCYYYRPNTNDCDDCTLLWFDRNGDGFLSIRRELRAVCLSNLQACDIIVERITGGGSCD